MATQNDRVDIAGARWRVTRPTPDHVELDTLDDAPVYIEQFGHGWRVNVLVHGKWMVRVFDDVSEAAAIAADLAPTL